MAKRSRRDELPLSLLREFSKRYPEYSTDDKETSFGMRVRSSHRPNFTTKDNPSRGSSTELTMTCP